MLRRRRFVLVITLVCSSTVSPAQEARGFGDSDKLAIEQMYSRYTAAFLTKDYTKLREVVQIPFFFFTGEVKDFESPDAVVAFYRPLREALERRGFDHGEILGTSIIALAADRAILNKSYRRYKKDGSLLEEGAAVYLVSKSSGSWKLCGVVTQDFKYFGKVY